MGATQPSPPSDAADDRYHGFPDGFFSRSDEDDDQAFYHVPRLVTHIDEGAIAAVRQLYVELGLAEGETLDLMSSWVSHHPSRPRRLVALGMSRVELEQNAQAHEIVVHDLNAEPHLPFPDASFDSATCCVSVDYLVRPIEVFDEVARVLRPSGPFVCTFSNRCFPTKAIAVWHTLDDRGHRDLVERFLHEAGNWKEVESLDRSPRPGRSDPLYALIGRRE